MDVNHFIENYDWRNALENCGVDGKDIQSVIEHDAGENDGQSWVAVLRLNDGRYCVIDAWCDYTGWDCQSGGHANFAASLNELRRWQMTSSQRRRLNMELKDLDEIPNRGNS